MGPILNQHGVLKYAGIGANIVFHGNSLVYGQSGATVPTGAMPYQTQRLAPVNNLVPCANMGVNGQSFPGMFTGGTGASVDALFDPSKKNVLVVWEGHNTIKGLGKTAAAAYADLQTYTSQKLSVNPGWLIAHMTIMPARYTSDSDTSAAATDASFIAFNQLLRNGYRTTGAKMLVDVRQQGSPFVTPPDYTIATFNAITTSGASVWSPGDGGQWVHLSDAGYAVIANMVAAMLRRMPTR